jgi:hypothetical protein
MNAAIISEASRRQICDSKTEQGEGVAGPLPSCSFDSFSSELTKECDYLSEKLPVWLQARKQSFFVTDHTEDDTKCFHQFNMELFITHLL